MSFLLIYIFLIYLIIHENQIIFKLRSLLINVSGNSIKKVDLHPTVYSKCIRMATAFHYILYKSSIKVIWNYNFFTCADGSGFKIFFTSTNSEFRLLLNPRK